jgi:hypothetical protein
MTSDECGGDEDTEANVMVISHRSTKRSNDLLAGDPKGRAGKLVAEIQAWVAPGLSVA